MQTKEHQQFYWVWADMNQRCRNPNHRQYANYGGRGIYVCDDWKSFENFKKDMWPRPQNHHIDRINNDDGYKKDNCRWATSQENNLNKRIYKNNKFYISGIQKRGDGYRARLRRNHKIICDKQFYDFFEACCFIMKAKQEFNLTKGS
jgi:hypothetical protein